MNELQYRGRRAVQIENESIRITVTREGGHIAEILHKPTGVNPLWTPTWPSIEPSTYERTKYPEYGSDSDGQLLAGILGHNLCLDTFGAPSAEEAAAGIPVHGEASAVVYDITGGRDELTPQNHTSKSRTSIRPSHPSPAGRKFARHIGNTRESLINRPPYRLDSARHPGAAFSRARQHRVPCVRHMFPSRRFRLQRRQRTSEARRSIRMAILPGKGRHFDRPSRLPERRSVGRLHRSSDGSCARASLFSRLVADHESAVRLCLEASRFSVARTLGRESSQNSCALER